MNATIQPELIPKTDGNWKPKEDALAPVTTLALMQIALERGQVEQLEILQRMHFKELEETAKLDFNEAMNAVQMELGRVAPNMSNTQTKSRYATYDKLDAVLRPIYTKHKFSLSFSTDPSVSPEIEMVRVVCHVSRGRYTRVYYYDMPADGKGAKGGDVMTKTHARGSAGSYGMRYLLKMIFNIAIGEDDDDGNGAEPVKPVEDLNERLEWIGNCSTIGELHKIFYAAVKVAKDANNYEAIRRLTAAKDAKKKDLE
jgi:hypothetical protein